MVNETSDIAARYAVLAFLRKHVASVESQAKDELDAHLRPGDRVGAWVGDIEVGTISKTKATTTTTPVVTDSTALLAWCREHRPDAIVESVAAWFTAPANMNALIAENGELPDGVDLIEQTKDPYLRVGTTPAQAEAITSLWLAGDLNSTLTTLPAIGES